MVSPIPSVTTAFNIVSKVVNDSGTVYGLVIGNFVNIFIFVDNKTTPYVIQAIKEYENTLKSPQSSNVMDEPDVSPASIHSASSTTRSEERNLSTDSDHSLPPVKRRKVASVPDIKRSDRIV